MKNKTTIVTFVTRYITLLLGVYMKKSAFEKMKEE